jgi:ATP-dependent RNA helicase DDX42
VFIVSCQIFVPVLGIFLANFVLKNLGFFKNFFRNLESSNQEVPKDLLELAMQSSWFKNSRYKKGRGKGVGGAGLGFRERPAIGFVESAESQVNYY